MSVLRSVCMFSTYTCLFYRRRLGSLLSFLGSVSHDLHTLSMLCRLRGDNMLCTRPVTGTRDIVVVSHNRLSHKLAYRLAVAVPEPLVLKSTFLIADQGFHSTSNWCLKKYCGDHNSWTNTGYLPWIKLQTGLFRRQVANFLYIVATLGLMGGM